MGFVGDVLSGRPNRFNATTPVNTFNAREADLQQQDFAPGLAAAQQQLLGANSNANAYVTMLQQQAAGQGGPSPAQIALQQALQSNQAQSAGQIGAQRGMNPGLAARLISQNAATSGQQLAGQGAMLRAQEQQNAQGLLGNAIGMQGQQGLGQFGAHTQGLQGQNALNLQNRMGAQGLNAGVAAGNQQANLQAQGINAGVAGQNAQASMALFNGLLGAAGGAAAAGMTGGAGKFAGGLIPGDHPANDVVDAKLSPGEIVLPRSVTMAPDAAEQAKSFVRAILRQKDASGGYGKVLARKRQ